MSQTRKNLTFLIIENDDSLSAVIQREIASSAHFAFVARDSAGAIATAHAARQDFILLDPDLPDGDGIDLGKKLRALRCVPIILITASKYADTAARLRGLHVDG